MSWCLNMARDVTTNDEVVHEISTIQFKDPFHKNVEGNMNGYFTKFGKSKLQFTSLHEFHMNRHPSSG
jgi:hypothetical protein